MRDSLRSVHWQNGVLWILDQRKLPGKVAWIRGDNVGVVARAIETLAVRGAPAIGVTAAYGVALAAQNPRANRRSVERAIDRLWRTRPTGFNLFGALTRMRELVRNCERDDLSRRTAAEAVLIHREDAAACNAMAVAGVKLFGKQETVLTYCHTGGPATGGIGTALGVIKTAYRQGKIAEVFACETRPVGQGARLTAWECRQAKIPVTLICDNMIASLMRARKIDRVLVGADRIALNGDTSNKIGTLGLAMIAFAHGVPFHIVAPTTTFDQTIESGSEIRIEERAPEEVTRITPGIEKVRGLRVWNPAFDVTPGALITSFVTEKGTMRPPFRRNGMKRVFRQGQP